MNSNTWKITCVFLVSVMLFAVHIQLIHALDDVGSDTPPSFVGGVTKEDYNKEDAYTDIAKVDTSNPDFDLELAQKANSNFLSEISREQALTLLRNPAAKAKLYEYDSNIAEIYGANPNLARDVGLPLIIEHAEALGEWEMLDEIPADMIAQSGDLRDKMEYYFQDNIEIGNRNAFRAFYQAETGLEVKPEFDTVFEGTQCGCKGSPCNPFHCDFASEKDIDIITGAFPPGMVLTGETKEPETDEEKAAYGQGGVNYVSISWGPNAVTTTTGEVSTLADGVHIANGGKVDSDTAQNNINADDFTGTIQTGGGVAVELAGNIVVNSGTSSGGTAGSYSSVTNMHINPDASNIYSDSIGDGTFNSFPTGTINPDLTFSDVNHAYLDLDNGTARFDDVRYLEVSTTNSQGQDNKFVIINGKDVVITDEGITAGHVDSVMINDNAVATNADELRARFEYYLNQSDTLYPHDRLIEVFC